ncbi:MAG: lysoplasmalogenase [Chloroflexi bacterium]|nr:lysoplasmalogenase [Chloroflexota bacterium]
MAIASLWLAQLALFAVGIFGPWRDAPERKNNGRLALPARMLLSFSLVAAAFIIWQGGASKIAVYSQWVFFGMLASFIGDLIMARLIPMPNRLIGGMVAFGIAHALYITAYNQTIQIISSLAPYDRWITGLSLGIGFYGVVSVVGWWLLIRNPEKGGAINIGALVYGLVIGVMASYALALGYALGFWLTAIGGLLFVASDFIIGITDIRGIQVKNANDWVWLTYVAGQMGIIYAGWVV